MKVTIIDPKQFGLEESKAKEMTSGLDNIIEERQMLSDAYLDVIDLDITHKNLHTFKELRLKIVKNRTQGIEKWHKTNKAFYLAGGRFVDAIKNKEIVVNQMMEEKLSNAENYFENLEIERLSKLQEERLKAVELYLDSVDGLDLCNMSEETFNSFLLGSKTAYETKIEAEKIEAKRLEDERIAELKRLEDQRLENLRLKKEAEAREKIIQKERDIAEKKRIAEAKKLAKLRKEKEDELKKEREAREVIEAKLRKEKEDKLKAKKDKEEAEAKAKMDAEKLAKAPIKKQLNVWIDSFELDNINVDNDITKEIILKFDSFKKWSKTMVESI